MGAEATRITAADFLTPSELADWSLASDGAGRIGGVRLQLRCEADRTRLGRCYQQVPVRVLPPFQFTPEQPALLYLLNPTAGLMDGDAQLIDIAAGPGTRTLVVGQSATRVHPSLRGFSTQQWFLSAAEGSLLIVLPGPAIPFQGCRYYQRAAIDLAEEARLIWGDVWLAGRYARGALSERFQFKTLVQDLSVRRQGQLTYRDRFCWNGPWDKEAAAWHFAGEPACGSVFATGPIPETVRSNLSCLGGAFFPTASGDVCLRWRGAAEMVTASVVKAVQHLAAGASGEGACGSLLSSHDLAPCHWFSLDGM
jgi:urease accessory protein